MAKSRYSDSKTADVSKKNVDYVLFLTIFRKLKVVGITIPNYTFIAPFVQILRWGGR